MAAGYRNEAGDLRPAAERLGRTLLLRRGGREFPLGRGLILEAGQLRFAGGEGLLKDDARRVEGDRSDVRPEIALQICGGD